MTFSRRDMLKLALAGAAHPLLPVRGIVSQAFAAPGAADTKFLLVFLRGGYDATNVIIPVGSGFYYEARPTIALPKPDPLNPAAAISLAGPGEAVMWGLHPALRESMLPLWQKGQLAFVPFAGTEDLTRSHFETQDSVESGMPVSAPGTVPQAYGSGFLNRLAASLDGGAAPVAFTDGLPVVMTGDLVVPNVSLKGTGRPAGQHTGSARDATHESGAGTCSIRRTDGSLVDPHGRRRALGGAVHGGCIAGEQVAVSPQTLNQSRDLPVLTEYRALLGALFKRMYSLDSTRLGRVFPNTVPRDLGLV
jgi:uncharacterized protein (DUF1501 family)